MSKKKLNPDSPGKVNFLFVGGCGEFGMNSMLVADHKSSFLVDCGALFPDAHKSGVDTIVPDFDQLLSMTKKINAIILTHGHEDHIGSLPFLLRKKKIPVYATPWTMRLIQRKFDYMGMKDCNGCLNPIEFNVPYKIAGAEFIWQQVDHSLPQAGCLFFNVGGHRFFHSGDFKMEHPDNPSISLAARTDIKKYGDKGVDVGFFDSTNAHKPGRCSPESIVAPALEEEFKKCEKAILVTTFSSNLSRLKSILEACKATKRRLIVAGRSLQFNYDAGVDEGVFKGLTDIVISDREAKNIPRKQLVIAATGCQGERMAGLSRILYGENRYLHLEEGDCVMFSSRIIPGNDLYVLRLMNHCELHGIDVVTTRDNDDIHVSGHGYQADIEELQELVSPSIPVAVHGSFSHLRHQNDVLNGEEGSDEGLMIQGGEIYQYDGEKFKYLDDHRIDRLFVDGYCKTELSYQTLRERLKIAELGLCVLSGVYDKNKHDWVGQPKLDMRGFRLPHDLDQSTWQKRAIENIRKSLEAKSEDPKQKDISELARIHLRKQLTDMLHKKVIVIAHIAEHRAS